MDKRGSLPSGRVTAAPFPFTSFEGTKLRAGLALSRARPGGKEGRLGRQERRVEAAFGRGLLMKKVSYTLVIVRSTLNEAAQFTL